MIMNKTLINASSFLHIFSCISELQPRISRLQEGICNNRIFRIARSTGFTILEQWDMLKMKAPWRTWTTTVNGQQTVPLELHSSYFQLKRSLDNKGEVIHHPLNQLLQVLHKTRMNKWVSYGEIASAKGAAAHPSCSAQETWG